jgi:hypothetical protein
VPGKEDVKTAAQQPVSVKQACFPEKEACKIAA